MPEKIPQFDFSKIEDQEKLEASSKEVKDLFISNSRNEAEWAQRLISSGNANNYEDALKKQVDVQKKIEDLLLEGYPIEYIEKLAVEMKINLSDKTMQEIFAESIVDYVYRGHSYLIEALISRPWFKDSKKSINKSIEKGFIKLLSASDSGNYFFDASKNILNIFSISEIKPSEEFIKSIEVREKIKKHVAFLLNLGCISEVNKLLDAPELMISDDELRSPEIKKSSENGFRLLSSAGELVSSVKYFLDTPELRPNDELLKNPDIRRNLDEGFNECLENEFFENVMVYFSTPELRPSDEALKNPKIKELGENGFFWFLSEGEIYMAKKLLEIPELRPSEEALGSAEILDSVKEGIEFVCSKKNNSAQEDDKNKAEKIKEMLSFANYKTLFDCLPDLSDKKNKLAESLKSLNIFGENKIDVLKNGIDRSLYLQVFLYEKSVKRTVNMIKKNPFLLDVIAGNEIFGLRLFAVYNKFNKTSKEKIDTLFQYQEGILAQNPEIQKDSAEFRLAMQEKLKIFSKNPKIIAEMGRKEIDIEAWLNYDDQEEFVLGGEALEEISILQFIERPFNRIMRETIPEYIKIVLDELELYKETLDRVSVPEAKMVESQERLTQMKKLLSETDDEEKRSGIEKGIASIEKGLSNPKTVSYTDKLRGAIFGLENMIKLAESKKEEIKQCEQEKKYQKINELKKKLYLDHKTLCVRFESFQKDLQECMDKYFGNHGEAIMQAVNHQTAEILSHFVTDNHYLKKVFEDADFDEQIKKTKAVSLELWNRNPDVDLYLGNYSPCCISIEGGAGWNGSESAIADYMTDVSIQVLNLMDKEKNIPIMSAWLYLGENEKGETAIVIDNIESNASQTDLYHDEIWKKIREYMINYAQKIGVKKVSMGSSNNDIEPEPKTIVMDDGAYRKIGPVNGNRPEGYYLESELKEDNYLIWKKK